MACGCELPDEAEPESGVIKGSTQAFCPARLRILILSLWQSAQKSVRVSQARSGATSSWPLSMARRDKIHSTILFSGRLPPMLILGSLTRVHESDNTAGLELFD